jgi:hypothetical protein
VATALAAGAVADDFVDDVAGDAVGDVVGGASSNVGAGGSAAPARLARLSAVVVDWRVAPDGFGAAAALPVLAPAATSGSLTIRLGASHVVLGVAGDRGATAELSSNAGPDERPQTLPRKMAGPKRADAHRPAA